MTTSQPGDQPHWYDYPVAAAAVALATGARLALDPVLGDNYPFVIYFAAVAAVAWFGRTPPAIFTLVASGVVAFYLFIPPRFSSATTGLDAWLGMGLYFAAAAVIVAMSHAMRVARRQAETALHTAMTTQDELRQAMIGEAQHRERLRVTLASVGDQEAGLRASEAQFRELADAMPQIVYATGADGTVEFVNRQWIEYTGQSDAQTADLGPLVHPDDLDAMVREWDAARAAGTPLQAEFRLKRADGEYRWFLTRSVPVRDGAGRAIKWFGTSTDIHEQKQAARKLAESEALYRAIGESIDFGVWVCDAEGRNIYASESFLRLVGITQQECSDFGWGDVLHPDDAEGTIAAWKECVRTRGTWDREHRFKGVDGEWHHVLARGVPRVDAAGNVLGWAGINLDVTRLVQTERELARLAAESERQRRLYETVLTNTPDFVYVFSLDHKVLYANDALIKMWGKGLDGAIGKTFLEIGYEPWHAEMHNREIDQVRATRQPIRGEVPFTGTYGQRQYDYIFVPVIGADGEVEAVAGTTRDVTDRKETERQLRESDERQAFLIRLSDTLRRLSDPVDVQAEASRLLGEHLGANRVVYFEIRGDDYVIERDYTAGVRPLAGRYPVASFGPSLLAELLDGRTVVEADATTEPHRPADEQAAFASIQVRGHVDVPLVKDGRFAAGMTVHVSDRREWTRQEVALIEDTAERTWSAVERVRAEREVARVVSRLREQDQRKDEFLATLAHELRNPLAPMRNGLQVIRMSGAEGTVEQVRSMMERQLGQMTRLVDDLLDASRVTSGKLQLRKQPVELRAVIDAAVETSRPAIEHAKHRLAIDVPDDPIVVDGDPVRLAQVVSNLLTNSARYTHGGGHIHVSVTRDAGTAVVTVTDDGVGIPPAMLEAVFGMFTQVDRTLEKTTGGLGIGLSLVKGLVEMHGGTVEARSEGEGRGSEFVVRLPLALHMSGQREPAAREPIGDAPAGRRRVVVVDDNADSADSLALLLEMLGNEVHTAYDGEAGVEVARRFRPDVVVCDIGMPKMNGYNVARQIRSEDWGQDVVLVALTGWGQDDDRKKSADAGFDHHLVKPVGDTALKRLLSGL